MLRSPRRWQQDALEQTQVRPFTVCVLQSDNTPHLLHQPNSQSQCPALLPIAILPWCISHRPLAGGEYQVVLVLLSAADVTAAAAAQLPLAAIPKMTLPFGQPPADSPGIAATAAANMKALGLSSSSMVAKVPLHHTPGDWSRQSYR